VVPVAVAASQDVTKGVEVGIGIVIRKRAKNHRHRRREIIVVKVARNMFRDLDRRPVLVARHQAHHLPEILLDLITGSMKVVVAAEGVEEVPLDKVELKGPKTSLLQRC
jgi:hypothetical protein